MPYSSRFLHSSERPDLSGPVLPIANTNVTMADSASARQGDGALPSPASTRSARKRAAPINTEAANKAKMEGMTLSTQNIVVRTGESARESICLCQQAPKIPRPRNGTWVSCCLVGDAAARLVGVELVALHVRRQPQAPTTRCYHVPRSLPFLFEIAVIASSKWREEL